MGQGSPRAPLLGIVLSLLLAGGVRAADPVTVTVIAEFRETHLAWQREIVEAFHQENPHIRIELVDTAGTGLVPKMQTMLAGGVPLDIGYMDPWLVVQWGKEGLLEPLDSYIEQDQEQFADWPDQVFEFYRTGGKLYGIPQDLQVGGIFYNIDMFGSAGVPTPFPGWTYADLEEMARRLRVVGQDGRAQRWGFRIPSSRNWVPVVWAFGGDLVDDWSDPTRFIGDSPQTVEALRYLQNLVEIGAAQDRVSDSQIPFAQAFSNQHVAMVQTNTISMSAFYSIEDFEWDVVPLPAGPAGRAGFINAIGWFMFSSSTDKEASWQVLKYFTAAESRKRRAEITGNMPPSVGTMQSVWLPALERPASRHLLLDEILYARSPWPLHGDIYTPMHQEVFSAIWGEQPVESAVENMRRRVFAAISQARAAD